MKGMDKSINLRFPGQETSLRDQIDEEVDEAVSVDNAFMEFMTITQGSGLSREQREDAYDDFLESMTKKWGANVKTELDSIMSRMQNELSVQDSLNNLQILSNQAAFAEQRKRNVPKE